MPIRKFVGLETEYSLHARHAGGSVSEIVDDQVHEKLVERLLVHAGSVARGWSPDTDRTTSWLPNGGLLYHDFGNHPEYATPESSDPLELIRQHKLGDAVMADAVARANATDSRFVRTVLKNNVDSAGHTFGTHESYCVDHSLFPHEIAAPFGSFLASRIVLTGAGAIVTGPLGDAHFEVSARARHITQLASHDTTNVRPLVNLRDEALADNTRFRRLHLICGDANRCDVANYLKVGTTAIVLGMLEDGVPFQRLTYEDPVEALRRTSAAPDQWPALRLLHGGAMTALEHQHAVATLAARYVEDRGHELFANPNTARDIVNRWHTVLAMLATDRRQTIGLLDWTTKANLLERRAQRDNLGLTNSILRQYDLRWGEITHGNLFEKLEAANKVDVLVPIGAQPLVPMLTPPSDSRAALRGHTVRRHADAIAEIRWDAITLTTSDPNHDLLVTTADPKRYNRSELETLRLTKCSESQFKVRLALEEIHRTQGFRNTTMSIELAGALLGCCPGASESQLKLFGGAVANGLQNSLRAQLHGASTSESRGLGGKILQLFVRGALLSGHPIAHADTLAVLREEFLAEAGRPTVRDSERQRRRAMARLLGQSEAYVRTQAMVTPLPPRANPPQLEGR
ncbi:MAG: proteasome accessory factor PafA2 family protein [Acidimicrobiia bacterium]